MVAKPAVVKPISCPRTAATSVITISVSTSASWLENTERERMWLTQCGGLSCDYFGILIADGLLDLANCNAWRSTKDDIYKLLLGLVETNRGRCIDYIIPLSTYCDQHPAQSERC